MEKSKRIWDLFELEDLFYKGHIIEINGVLSSSAPHRIGLWQHGHGPGNTSIHKIEVYYIK